MPIATIATAPVISGTITAGTTGDTLTCSTGTWTTDSTITGYTYQWQRAVAAGIDISGATSSTYTTTINDSGYPLKCVVTATNASGNSVGAISSNSLTMWVSNINSPIFRDYSLTVNTGTVSLLDNLPTAYQLIESKQTNLSGPPNSQEYTTAGTYSWVVPYGVISVSAVLVGGGGSASYLAGGGGGLRWINNLPVTPGEILTIQTGAANENSFIARGSNVLVQANAAIVSSGGTGTTIGAGPFGGTVGGGNGGSGGNGGGGGAGGYSGNGGNGGSYASSSRGSYGQGGGGGGGEVLNEGGGGGGGVGILGEGSNGSSGYNGSGGSGGSGGGGGGSMGGPGGIYGGGGGRNLGGNYGTGGRGAVRIIWGAGRSFPSTLTAESNLVTYSVAPETILVSTNTDSPLILDDLPTAYQLIESKQANLVGDNTINPDKVLLDTTGSVIVSYATYGLTDNKNIEKGAGAVNQQTWTLGV